MVIIGYRTEINEHGQQIYYFLLQHWWITKQFVEMDEDYLEASNATITFVKTPQTHFLKSLPLLQDRFMESTNLDKLEARSAFEAVEH